MISVSYKLPLTLALLCTSFLAFIPIQVNCSPLPGPGKHTISESRNPTQSNEKYSYPLMLLARSIDNEKIHISLVIGISDLVPGNQVLQARFQNINDFESPLIGNHGVFPPTAPRDELISLNAHIEFTSPKAFLAEVDALSRITMEKKPTEKGGNYADYVKKVLEKLVDQRKLQSVPEEFTTWYNTNYEKVSKGMRLKQEKGIK
ncbi:hypothetical protein BDP27DRAFT_1424613 [Rhodocollybia butyracea]|uniref:Uncharacterized protein n=1 Tax=Rhodocollybia butyracea TaxID=206335 RepID=A0A9P5PP90_9AGAR|nr:hypothetical protein BDP27DRAFT_1424613 [Rhodocollybia butyracea]